jgi:hypothetical protein
LATFSHSTAMPSNRALKGHKLAPFTEVLRRRWLLVDIDPRRPAKISSSDAEYCTALQLAQNRIPSP